MRSRGGTNLVSLKLSQSRVFPVGTDVFECILMGDDERLGYFFVMFSEQSDPGLSCATLYSTLRSEPHSTRFLLFQ